MNHKSSFILATLFSVTFVATGISIVKIYPIFASGFTLLIFSALFKSQIKLTKISLFLLILFLYLIVHISLSSTHIDIETQVKFVINYAFFVALVIYLYVIKKTDSNNFLSIFLFSVKLFILFSFLNALYLVITKNLWLLPFNLTSSRDSYAIVRDALIIFGEQQKNIWAQKISLSVIYFISSLYIGKSKIKTFDYLVMGFALFNMLYVNSRTSWAMVIAFALALFFYHYVIIKRNLYVFLGLLLAAALLAEPIIAFFLDNFIWFDINQPFIQTATNQGDGLFQRFILWKETILLINQLGVIKFIFGSGLFSFEHYLGYMFSENNPHNLFLNLFLDFGVIGFIYICWLTIYVFTKSKFSFWVLSIPFLVNFGVRGLGYDIDMFIYLFFSLAISVRLTKKI